MQGNLMLESAIDHSYALTLLMAELNANGSSLDLRQGRSGGSCERMLAAL